ncbi:GH1 family beta-glucosidase [Allokutzneria sp. NRRL B-24872]|uniref:GH1 family beta-glucosidase n=1 Tax=Allokutzneria sp. NRRL B-24872 TaxID=1137961 RepID=UPI00143DD1DA|nr:GH1 family beta-glucosidase [Allokutzneria sp. NRRL B-24872]
MTTTDPVRVQEELRFPTGFLWGSATSSYQIEGASTVDGRGPSIWDTFAATPGKVDGGDTGAVACDHYHRYPEDIALMRRLGLPAYRFSIAWPRVQPTGSSTINRAGLAFYDRLVDALLEAGIQPLPTLYHWDLPQALQDNGGWTVRDTAARFADYAAVVHSHLGDRVTEWTTLNEPFCSAYLGYFSGVHAPGETDAAQALRALHHLLLGHGLATQAMRAQAPANHKFSLVLNFSPVRIDHDDPAHREAQRKADGLQNRIFLDPVVRGEYPADVLADIAHVGALEAVVQKGDLEIISAPLDWLGVNYYSPTRVAPAAPDYVPQSHLPGLRGVDMLPPRGPLTGIGWEQEPAALRDLLVWLSEQAPGLPLLVTENGSAFEDVVTPEGRIHDTGRRNYLVEHLRAVHDAVSAGANVRGYLAWSLLDNFEWAFGYRQRFGIVHVDFETQQRTLKDSARLFADIVRDNTVPPT